MFDEDDSEGEATSPRLATLPDRNPAEIEHQVCALTLASSADEVAAALDAADWLMGRAKTVHYLSRQFAIRWIDHNGEFDVGHVHYSVGRQTAVRCADTRQCGIELLDRLQGDFQAFLEVLVAQPYKTGSAKRILTQAAYGNLFVARSTSRLIAGVPEQVLKRTDRRFVS